VAILSNFLERTGDAYDWDDFLTFPIADEELNLVRQRCLNFDPGSDEGRAQVRIELDSLAAKR